MNNLHTFSDIKTFVFDVDGVMTDCSVLVMEDGQLLRTMNVRDGYAMKMAVRAGYRVIIITAGRSPGVEIRLRALGVTDILLGREDKATALLELMQQYGFSPEETLYMGDDVPDLKILSRPEVLVRRTPFRKSGKYVGISRPYPAERVVCAMSLRK